MYKLAKYLYELGQKNAYDRLRSDLYLFIGQEPIRYNDLERGISESEAAFKKRVDAWFAARELLDKFFQDPVDGPKDNWD